MKWIKIPVITAVFVLSLAFAYSQESGDVSVTDDDSASVVTTDTADVENGGDAEVSSDSSESDRTEPVSTDKKETAKKATERETARETKIARNRESESARVEENESSRGADSSGITLMRIDEGNFKYKRIPDIKLPENQVQVARELTGSDAVPADSPAEGGFWGMSKSASDIFVKVGVILFIFIIFILYKSRMRSPGGRKAGRKVLNSYRK